MGGACSRKREQLDNEDVLHRCLSRRYSKSASSKWLATSFSRSIGDMQQGNGKCPSLMELCVKQICEVCAFLHYTCFRFPSDLSKLTGCFSFSLEQDIDKYTTFSILPRDISQQIFNELVCSQRLTDVSLEAFRDCALQVNGREIFGMFF